MQDTPGGESAAVHEGATTGASATIPPATPPFTDLPGMALRDWLREGLRASVLLKPRVGRPDPAVLHLLVLVLFVVVLQLALQRLEVAGPANFSLRGWLSPWWTSAATALLVWSLFSTDARRPGVAAWFALVYVAVVPLMVVGESIGAASSRGWMPASFETSPVLAWGVYLLLWAWDIAVSLRVASALGLRAPRLAVLATGLLALNLVSAWYFRDRAWYPVRDAKEDEAPRLELSQDVFESQQALRDTALHALKPQRPGVVDVYAVVFAPYASEDVFLRESTMVSGVLRERFDAEGRVLQLVNNPSTTSTLPWATTQNLQRAVDAVAQKMDRDEDVLVVYLTSHGASNHVLAAEHWPLQVPGLKPEELRQALDRAGIRHRVIAVSACYSGGWVEPLATDDSLVMTAADATHTSYGCGRKSPLTFFGRAVFDEQLRHTHSFEDAFAAAVPLIRQREIEGKKADGFSNPQIRVGAGIRPVLASLARRLEGQP